MHGKYEIACGLLDESSPDASKITERGGSKEDVENIVAMMLDGFLTRCIDKFADADFKTMHPKSDARAVVEAFAVAYEAQSVRGSLWGQDKRCDIDDLAALNNPSKDFNKTQSVLDRYQEIKGDIDQQMTLSALQLHIVMQAGGALLLGEAAKAIEKLKHKGPG